MRSTLTQKQIIWDLLGYTPTDAALQAHACEARFVLVAGGVRGSKSKSAAFEAIPQCTEPNQLGWLVGPDYEQTRPEFNYILDALASQNFVASVSAPRTGGAAMTTICKTEIVTKTADDPVKLASRAPDWIILCEAAQCSYETYLRCIERLAEKRGWLWMCGTFERSFGWYAELFQRWQGANDEDAKSFSLPSWSNRFVFPGGEHDAEIRRLRALTPPDVFMERFGGVPCPPSNLVLKEFSYATHVFDWVQFDESKPVEVWVDPGYSGSHYAVEFVQFHPRAETRAHMPALPDVSVTDVWMIDELYLDHAIHEEVIALATTKPCWANVRGGVGDVVMKTHPQADRAPIDVWSARAGIFLRGQYVDVAGNIDRHRTFLRDPASGSPRLFFNSGCKDALGEYGRWVRKRIGENMFGEPESTNCDALKAIGYGLIDRFGHVEYRARVDAPALAEPRGNPFAMRVGV